MVFTALLLSAVATTGVYVLEGGTAEPLGPFTFKGRLATDSEALAIDGTVFETPEGVLYAIRSGRPEPGSDEQHLSIALMTDPWTTSGPRFLLSRPELEWETAPVPGGARRTAINEGPAVLLHNGRTFVSYSANTCFPPDYAVGVLALAEGADPLDTASWSKFDSPVLARSDRDWLTAHR